MKRLLVAAAVVVAMVGSAIAYDLGPTFKSNASANGKTFATVELSSTTVDFWVTDIEAYAVGDYATMDSSMTAKNSSQYITPNAPLKIEYAKPVNFSGTSNKIKFTLQANTTIYYHIGGVKTTY
jgi:hypothetical protein